MEDDIEPGFIFYFFCDNTKPPKKKYLVLLSINPILWFFINSEISPFIENDPSLKKRQIPLIRNPNHMFLDHDSYIDCLSVQEFEDINLDDLKEMRRDPNILVGKLDQSVIEDIIKKVTDPITISPYHEKIIIKSLS
jgi:hypothetical protein